MRQVPCILGSCSKDLSVQYYVLYWDHLSLYGHLERKEILNPSSCKVGIMWKTLKVELLQTCFVIEDFGSNRTSIAIGNAWRLLVLKVRRDFILDGLLVQNVANIIQSVNAFIGEFDIQKRAVPCVCRFTDPDSFEKPVWRNIQINTLKSMSRRSNVSKMQGQGGLVQGM